MKRPAETANGVLGGAVVGALLIFHKHLDKEQVTGVVAVLAALPGIVSWAVDQYRSRS